MLGLVVFEAPVRTAVTPVCPYGLNEVWITF